MNKKKQIEQIIQDGTKTILNTTSLVSEIEKAVNVIIKCIKSGNKVVLFGNGGSAADAQHIAAELIGKFKKNRKSIPALALTTDTSILTSLSNDYSFDIVFSRQCESLVTTGDVVIGISTSGNSKNVLNGIISAKRKDAITIGLLGNKGGKLKKLVDIPVIVNSSSVPRIQEAHRIISHIICEIVETELAN